MQGIVYQNGRLVPPDQAQVSIFDRGFLYGDSIYETLRVYDGTPFALAAHLDRLWGSAGLVGLQIPWSKDELRQAIGRALDAAALPNAYMRIIITRGSGAIGLAPSLAVDPQLLVCVLPLPPLPERLYTEGRHAALVSQRRNLEGAVNPAAKTGNYMSSVLALQEAGNRGADEAIMLDAQGRVAEASSANVFALVDDVWCTPPLEVGILSGITRRTLLQMGAEAGIAMQERVLWPADLRRATELCLCSSVREVVPVVQLDGEPVGSGKVGPKSRTLLRAYRSYVRRRGAT